MAEQLDRVGLQAIMDLREWNKGFTQYINQLGQVSSQTEQTAQKSSMSFKDMAKWAAGIGTAIGAAKIVNELKNITQQAAGIGQVAAAFEGVSGGADKMLASLRKGSAGMVADVDLMKSYNSAAQLVGKSFADQLPSAFQYLGKVAAASGQDMGFMLDSLVKGVGRLSPMILDNLGIQVNLTEANEAYAKQLGKSSDELTKSEQQIGMMNMVMAKLQANTAAMPDIAGSAAAQFASFNTTMVNLKNTLGTQLVPILSSITSAMSQAIQGEGMDAAMQSIGAAAQKLAESLNKMLPQIVDLAARGIPMVLTGFAKLLDALGGLDVKILGVSGAIATVTAILAANPIVLAAAGIVAAGVAISSVIKTLNELSAQEAAARNEETLALVRSTESYEMYLAKRQEELVVIDASMSKYDQQAAVMANNAAAAALTREEYDALRASMSDAAAVGEELASDRVFGGIRDGLMQVADAAPSAADAIRALEKDAGDGFLKMRVESEKTAGVVSEAMAEAFKSDEMVKAQESFEKITEDHYDKLAKLDQKFTEEQVERAFDYNLERAQAEQEYQAERSVLLEMGKTEEIAKLDAKFQEARTQADNAYSIENQEQQRNLLIQQAQQQEAYVAELIEQRDQNIRLMAAQLMANEQFQKLEQTQQDLILATLFAGGSEALLMEYKRGQERLKLEHAVTSGVADEAQNQVDIWVATQAATVEAAQKGLADARAKVAAFKIDIPPPDFAGIRARVTSEAAATGRAAGAAAGKSASVATKSAISAVADEVTALNKAVTEASQAILKLEGFEVTPGVSTGLERFRGFIEEAITQITGAIDSLGMDAEDIKGATDFSNAAEAMIGLVKPALEAIMALAQWEQRESVAEQMTALLERIKEIVPALELASKDFDQEALGKAAEIYKSAEAIVGFIAKAIEAITDLQEWERTQDVAEQVTALVARISEIVPALESAAKEYKLSGLLSAKAVYEAMEGIIGFVKPALEAIIALVEWERARVDFPAITKLLAEQITDVVTALEEAAREMKPASATAIAFYDSVVEMTGFIGDAIEVLGDLEKWEPVQRDYAELTRNLIDDLWLIAGTLELEGKGMMPVSQTTRDFYKSIAELVDIVGPAVEAVSELGDYVRPAANLTSQIKKLLDDLWLIVGQLELAAVGMGETSKPARAFYASVSEIIDVVKPAIDAIAALATYVPPAGDIGTISEAFARKMAQMVNGLQRGIGWPNRMTGESIIEQVKPEAIAFFRDANEIIGIVEPGIDAIAKLLTYKPAGNDLITQAQAFARSMAQAMRALTSGLEWPNRVTGEGIITQMDPQAIAFWESVDQIIGVIEPAIEALTALGEYVSKLNLMEHVNKFKADLYLLLPVFESLTTDWASKITEETSLLSGYIAAAMEMMTAGLEALAAIGAYQKIEALGIKLGVIAQQLGEVFEKIKTDILPKFETGLDDLREFAEKMAVVKDAMALAVEALNEINKVAGISISKATAQLKFNMGILEKDLTVTNAIVSRILPLAQAFGTTMGGVYDALIAGLAQVANIGALAISNSPFAGIQRALNSFFTNPPRSLLDAAYSLGWKTGAEFEAGFRGALGIASPSTVMENLGAQMRAGLQQGFEQARVPYQGAATTNNYRNQSVSLAINANVASDVDVDTLGRRVLQIVAQGMRV